MIDFLNMDSNKLVISEFYENDKAGKYDYDTVYQREKVWSEETRSFFIDSIMKNYPIPPVFLRMKIDSKTGITKYEVIDGKQRLTTIRDFIDGKVLLPDDFGDDKIGDSELNGASFCDLDKIEKYKKQFWHYRIPVIFIETDDRDLIKSVFDRLNRNGVPLTFQELRNAKYGESDLYRIIKKLSSEHCWRKIFDDVLENDRKEDEEFTSELLFLIVEEKVISYTKDTLDELYEKWSSKITEEHIKKFYDTMDYIREMNLDYINFKINKVSHLYAVWGVSYLGLKQNIDANELGKGLSKFYNDYLCSKEGVGAEDYKKSMSSNTKGARSRVKRMEALISYLQNMGIKIKMMFG
jgi:hypothetical protein